MSGCQGTAIVSRADRPTRLRFAGLVFAIGLATTACQPGAPVSQSPAQPASGQNFAERQEFRFSLTGEPPGLDPQYTSWDASIAVLSSLFDSLLAFDEHLKLVP